MTSLKPCPFCGGPACLERDTDGSVYVEVDHEPSCYLEVPYTSRWFYAKDGKTSEQVAAEEWNRRAERTCEMTDNGCELCCSECDCRCEYDDEPAYCPHCGVRVIGADHD